ncbi:MAG: DUF192 domain-containing protein [Nanoarchaeota archaeon]|nr:DUF192 domain-containing protein [Nanoarchaeota archaeon]
MEIWLNKRILLNNVKICNNLFSKLKGFMFSRRREGILFELSRESKELAAIHMLFVFFPLDVYWLNKDFKVVDLKLNVKPFRIHVAPKKKAKYILETPANSIKQSLLGKKLEIR